MGHEHSVGQSYLHEFLFDKYGNGSPFLVIQKYTWYYKRRQELLLGVSDVARVFLCPAPQYRGGLLMFDWSGCSLCPLNTAWSVTLVYLIQWMLLQGRSLLVKGQGHTAGFRPKFCPLKILRSHLLIITKLDTIVAPTEEMIRSRD